MSTPDPMTAAALLSVLEPHRDMLRKMGVSIMYPPNDGKEYAWPVEIDGELSEESPKRLSRLIADVVMERLERWQSGKDMACMWLDDGSGFVATMTYANREPAYCASAPTRLAALLALAAWCRKERGV